MSANKKKQKDYPLVVVHWMDIVATADWTHHSEVSPEPMVSIGWLIQKDKKVVKQATTIYDGDMYGVQAYPAGCVVKIETLPEFYASTAVSGRSSGKSLENSTESKKASTVLNKSGSVPALSSMTSNFSGTRSDK